MSARDFLESKLQPFAKDKKWTVVPVAKALGNIDRVQVVLKMSSLTRATDTQGKTVTGTYYTEWDILLINPSTDLAKAQVLLDDDVIELFDHLDSFSEIEVHEATAATLNDTWAGFTIRVHTYTNTSQE